MPSVPQIHWSSAQKEALDKAKEELLTYLDGVNFQRGMKRKEPRGEGGMSVIEVRDRLIDRLMETKDLGGDNAFPIERTRV
jgi:hypothetical protein